jgi:hypothetical protein
MELASAPTRWLTQLKQEKQQGIKQKWEEKTSS